MKKAGAKKEKTGVIYARYSSHAQKDASIEQQVRECLEFAKVEKIHIISTYEDRALSGKTDNRPNFQRMIRDAEKKKFDHVIAWKSNRMGRNMLQAMINEARLNDMGVRVMYVEEDFDDTAAGRFALRSMMNVNQFYSEAMAEDIRRGMEDNALQCKITNGTLPYGYKKGKDGRYALDEEKAEIVREIFRKVAHGELLVDIASDLNSRGIKTTRGGPWNKNSFHRLLSNERYMGIYIYDHIRIEGGVPQIISPELFHQVQEVLRMKKNPQGRPRSNGDYILTGKLFCGYCGSPMVGLSGTSKGGTLHHYYGCRKRRFEKSCHKAYVKQDVIEDAVIQAIRNHALQDDVIEWIADGTLAHFKKLQEGSHLNALEHELADIKRSIKNIMNAIEQGIFTDTTKERLLELEKEQTRLEREIDDVKSQVIPISKKDLIAGLAMFRDGDINSKIYRVKLIDTFLAAVYLYDDKLRIVFTFSGNNSVSFPLDSEIKAALSEDPECSFPISDGSPEKSLAFAPFTSVFAGLSYFKKTVF